MANTATRGVGMIASAMVLIGTVTLAGAASSEGAAVQGRSPLTTPPADWMGEANVIGAGYGAFARSRRREPRRVPGPRDDVLGDRRASGPRVIPSSSRCGQERFTAANVFHRSHSSVESECLTELLLRNRATSFRRRRFRGRHT